MTESPPLEPLNLAPFVVSEIVTGVPIAKALNLKPRWSKEGEMMRLEHPDLGIDVYAPTRGELWNELRGQLAMLWHEYALEADDKLSAPALQLKSRLLNLAKPPRDTTPLQDLIPCFECVGTLRAVILPYQTELPGLGAVTVEEVPMLRCPDCGDTVIGYQGSARIDCCLNELRHQHCLPMPRKRSRTRSEKETSRP